MKKIKKSALLMLAVVFVYFIYMIPSMIIIKTAVCRNQAGECSEKVLSEIEKVEGENLRYAKRKLNEYFENEKLIKDHSIRFQLPPSLVINAIERTPKFTLKDTISKETVLVDEEGFLLESVENFDLPVIEIEGINNFSERVDSKILFAGNLLYRLESYHQLTQRLIADDSLIIELDDSIRVIFPLEGDGQLLLGALRLVNSQLNSGAKDSTIMKSMVKEIDLRFKNPVLRY
jgi:hypothetical protein